MIHETDLAVEALYRDVCVLIADLECAGDIPAAWERLRGLEERCYRLALLGRARASQVRGAHSTVLALMNAGPAEMAGETTVADDALRLGRWFVWTSRDHFGPEFAASERKVAHGR